MFRIIVRCQLCNPFYPESQPWPSVNEYVENSENLILRLRCLSQYYSTSKYVYKNRFKIEVVVLSNPAEL